MTLLKENVIMKKYLILFLMINTTSLYALIGGIGINVVQDQFKIPAVEDEVFDASITFSTSSIEDPIGVGIFIYLTAIPKIDLEVGCNFTFATYKYELVEQGLATKDNDFAIGKGTLYASVQYPFFNPPTFRLYGGLGANGSKWTRVVNKELLQEAQDKGVEFNKFDELAKILITESSGFHVELGARLKPPVLPVSFNVNARYNLVKDFYPDIDDYLTVTVGIAYAI